ncbi:hypothetical protein MMYC01_205282 [Madurella mycetomatis]|uniref:Uncharacterized protein n=1 Tax=Madurella mycetomatis TaxID=100816 RepID=A0A175W4G4_9PEZI|nr:hypothetical protein MMYC01_205282 [Madurella mycetomatis]
MPHPKSDSPGDGQSSFSQPATASTSAIPLPDLYPGLLPALPDDPPAKPPASSAATGASAAGVRALTSQAVAFYFRAPVKAFFRTRVDYLAYARALQEQELEQRRAARLLAASSLNASTQLGSCPSSSAAATPTKSNPRWWRWLRTRLRATTPGVLASAVRRYGWRVVPDQVLPPLVANVGVGAVLYTSYLQVLARLHPESGLASKRVYPPPSPGQTFAAGLVAGAIQSVVAAPLDAVQARYDFLGGSAAGMRGSGNPAGAGVATGIGAGTGGHGRGNGLERPKSMWAFSAAKWREIGLRGIFAGWGLSFAKDSMGSAIFFSVFEYLKAQGYYSFVTWYYGALNEDTILLLSRKRPPPTPADGPLEGHEETSRFPTVIRPHYAIEPAFLLLAGVGASFAQQVVLHPLSHVQAEHWERLEGLDAQARKFSRYARTANPPERLARRWHMFKAYRDAYRTTWAECVAEAKAANLGMRQWLYRGFWWNTIRQVPSTSAGLIIFELVRRKYGFGGDQVRINRDGYDILLN